MGGAKEATWRVAAWLIEVERKAKLKVRQLQTKESLALVLHGDAAVTSRDAGKCQLLFPQKGYPQDSIIANAEGIFMPKAVDRFSESAEQRGLQSTRKRSVGNLHKQARFSNRPSCFLKCSLIQDSR